MNCKRSILSAAIVASLSFAAQLHAQETATTTHDATELDTITVVGIRGSVEKSLDIKRDADSHVEVVTAEDIGKLSPQPVHLFTGDTRPAMWADTVTLQPR